MGTNYYHHRDICPCCRRSAEVEHIGKSSAGWTFSFHGTEHIRSWAEWREELTKAGGRIVDEYGEEHTLADFVALVDAKSNAPNKHFTYMAKNYPPDQLRDEWVDDEGHSFSGGEFS